MWFKIPYINTWMSCLGQYLPRWDVAKLKSPLAKGPLSPKLFSKQFSLWSLKHWLVSGQSCGQSAHYWTVHPGVWWVRPITLQPFPLVLIAGLWSLSIIPIGQKMPEKSSQILGQYEHQHEHHFVSLLLVGGMCRLFLEWTGQLLCLHNLIKVFGIWVGGGGWYLPFLKPASSQCGNGELWWDGPRWVAVGCGLGRRQRRRTSRGIRRRSFYKHLAWMLLLSIWQDIRSSSKHLALLAHHNRMLLGLSGGATVVFRIYKPSDPPNITPGDR